MWPEVKGPRSADWSRKACSAASKPAGTRSGANELRIGAAGNGTLDDADDVDYWRIEVPSSGAVVVETTGGTDTAGHLEDASGRELAADDDGGAGGNFRIERDLDAGTYYVRVSRPSGATGDYRLHVRHTPDGRFETFTFTDGIEVRWKAGTATDRIASAMDYEGHVHIAWADGDHYDGPVMLRYCRFDGTVLSRCAELHPPSTNSRMSTWPWGATTPFTSPPDSASPANRSGEIRQLRRHVLADRPATHVHAAGLHQPHRPIGGRSRRSVPVVSEQARTPGRRPWQADRGLLRISRSLHG